MSGLSLKLVCLAHFSTTLLAFVLSLKLVSLEKFCSILLVSANASSLLKLGGLKAFCNRLLLIVFEELVYVLLKLGLGGCPNGWFFVFRELMSGYVFSLMSNWLLFCLKLSFWYSSDESLHLLPLVGCS